MKKGTKGQFLLLFLSFASLFLALIFIFTMMLYSPPPNNREEALAATEIIQTDETIFTEEVKNYTYYYERINRALLTPKVEPYQLSDLLYQFSTYLNNESDLELTITGRLFIARTYLSFSETIEDALFLALKETEKVSTLIERDNNKTDM